MTPAQKKNAVKFKEAIAIRKKTGCSLKEAFAKVYRKTKAAPKKAAKKKAVKKSIWKPIKKSAAKNKVSKKSATHKDTKSHNVNIRVMSGNKSLGAYKLNPFTFTQLKKLNPLYFQNGWETWFGVKGKKIISSNKLGCQVYVEKINRPYLGIHYTCRKISREGTLGDLRRFHDISELEKHVDKYIKF